MFFAVCLVLMAGYPVAFSLAGVGLLFAGIGILAGSFQAEFLLNYPERVFGTMTNTTLIAVPLFVLMGVILERSKIAEELLENMSKLCGHLPAGLGISVIIVGAMLAASTGIVGATVVTMGLMSLPTMLKQGYSESVSCGTICATGTLGQIIPPSIALVLLGDIISTAYQEAKLELNIFNAPPVTVGDLFVGAIVPGLILVMAYIAYLIFVSYTNPQAVPRAKIDEHANALDLVKSIGPPILLIVLVLGSIISGKATPTEASGVGAITAFVLALLKRQMTLKKLQNIMENTTQVTTMVFSILLGASLFSLVFNGLGGDHQIERFFDYLPGGTFMAITVVMIVIFFLGFILDFFEITFVIVPLVAPVLLKMGVDPVWLGIMIAVNLQTSFLTPPFGFALFYLRGVAPKTVSTIAIYRGVIPFIIIQLFLLAALAKWPGLVTWLPSQF
ncbi:MAG: TRAP transporter large permease subunit [Agarilytica sp.]